MLQGIHSLDKFSSDGVKVRSGDVVDRLLSVETPDQAVGIFRKYLQSCGFENLLVGKHDLSHIAIGPDGWGEYYFEEGFPLYDPVLRAARQLKQPHTWDSVCVDAPLYEKKFMAECAAGGLRDGLSVPIHDKLGLRANISVSARDTGADPVRHLREIAIVGYAYSLVDTDLPQPDIPKQAVLTKRERECLQWAAAGKTYDEIASILSIRRRTVIAHMSNSMDKYGASNITGLCVQALMAKEIELPG